jgi:hypothetical protein
MATRKHSDWTVPTIVSLVGLGLALFGVFGGWATFYYGTQNTLANHDKQFQEVGKKFDAFTQAIKETASTSKETADKNFREWLEITKREQEKADKVRDQLSTAITTLTTSSVATKVQVDSLTKNVDSALETLRAISSVQQENRIRQQQGVTTGRGR